MRAITICQPWAWAILAGHKRYENRDWHTDYVGPLVIHAGKSLAWMDEGLAFIRKQGLAPPPAKELPRGVLLGLVRQTGCVRTAEAGDPWAFGPWCHEYAEPELLRTPIDFRGMLSHFAVPLELVEELLATAELRAERARIPGAKRARKQLAPTDPIEEIIDHVGRGRIRRGVEK